MWKSHPYDWRTQKYDWILDKCKQKYEQHDFLANGAILIDRRELDKQTLSCGLNIILFGKLFNFNILIMI